MTTPALPSLAPASVFSFEALWRAAHRASRGKRLQPVVARYRLDLEPNLLALRDELLAGRWQPRGVVEMVVHDGKTRVISVPAFRDRIVHHAIAEAVGPRVERRMIHDACACREGVGTHAAYRRARAWARTYRWWVRLDVQRYFPTIDHGVVRAQLAEDVPHAPLRVICERVLDAMGTLGAGHRLPGEDLLAPLTRRAGLGLGSLLSQLWANRFLDPVDHLVKDRLRHHRLPPLHGRHAPHGRRPRAPDRRGEDRGVGLPRAAVAAASVVPAAHGAGRGLRGLPGDARPCSRETELRGAGRGREVGGRLQPARRVRIVACASAGSVAM